MSGKEVQKLSRKAVDYGITLSSTQLDLFRKYLDELWEWNRHMNLTGLSTRDRMVIELFLDSLIPAPLLSGQGTLLDVGSGAGLPGLPLKIYYPKLQTHLLEANSKKIHFLRHVLRILKLSDISALKGRIEKDQSRLNPCGYRLITARALADLAQTLNWCAPLLEHGGQMLCFLGKRGEDTLRDNRELVRRHRLRMEHVVPYVLPGKKEKRYAVIFKKVG